MKVKTSQLTEAERRFGPSFPGSGWPAVLAAVSIAARSFGTGEAVDEATVRSIIPSARREGAPGGSLEAHRHTDNSFRNVLGRSCAARSGAQ
jgi:hypothetical protein